MSVLTDDASGDTTNSGIFYLGDLWVNPGSDSEIVEVSVCTNALAHIQIADIDG